MKFVNPTRKVGDIEQKCMCDREGCRWGTNGLDFMAAEAQSAVAPVCKPADDVNFCAGLTADQVPSGVTASCLNDRYDVGSRCQLECADPGQAFNGKIFDKEQREPCLYMHSQDSWYLTVKLILLLLFTSPTRLDMDHALAQALIPAAGPST